MSNQKRFSAQERVISAASFFDCIKPSSTVYLDCRFPVIYLITCIKCSPQYVGDTSQKITEQFNWHKACLKISKTMTFAIYRQIFP